jgi:hypothetical protein
MHKTSPHPSPTKSPCNRKTLGHTYFNQQKLVFGEEGKKMWKNFKKIKKYCKGASMLLIVLYFISDKK